MKIYIPFLLLFIFSSCSKIPTPSLLAPSENQNIQSVNFGDNPVNYQKILKEYLINSLRDYKTAKVEFVNTPSKMSISHLSNDYNGYRVCLSINEKKGDFYVGYRNHFFLINNDRVNLHLFDSGLLTIPFEYCVSRNIDKEIYIDDIPDEKEQISIEGMDKIKLASKDDLKYKKLETEIETLKQENKKLKELDAIKLEDKEKSINDLAKIETPREIEEKNDNIYILCTFNDKDSTYIFNANEETFRLIDKLDVVTYAVSFNEAFIVATNESIELTINRVSGSATYENKTFNEGICKLTDKTKF